MEKTEGVYFRTQDYASFWRRLLIEVIDAAAVAAGAFIAIALIWSLFGINRVTFNVGFLAVFLLAFLYLVVLKRSRVRTMGYRIAGVRIVGFDGGVPGIGALTLRLLVVPLGPLNWLIDLGWLCGDTHRQSLRDKLAHTYVVRIDAKPIGTGKILYRQCYILGYNFLFREVSTPSASLPV